MQRSVDRKARLLNWTTELQETGLVLLCEKICKRRIKDAVLPKRGCAGVSVRVGKERVCLWEVQSRVTFICLQLSIVSGSKMF